MVTVDERAERKYYDDVVREYRKYSRTFATAAVSAALAGSVVLLLLWFVGWVSAVSTPDQRVAIKLPELSTSDYFAAIGVAVTVVIALQIAVRGGSLGAVRPAAAEAGRTEFLVRASYAVAAAVLMVCAARLFGRHFDLHAVDLGRIILEPAVALVVMSSLRMRRQWSCCGARGDWMPPGNARVGTGSLVGCVLSRLGLSQVRRDSGCVMAYSSPCLC